MSPEGNILIPVEDFLKIFESFTVCFYESGFLSSGIRSNEAPYIFTSYQVDVKKKGVYYFRLSQLSHYMIHPESNITKIKYDKLTLLISKVDVTEELTYLAGACQRERDIWVKLNLEPGVYKVFVNIQKTTLFCTHLDKKPFFSNFFHFFPIIYFFVFISNSN